MTADAQLANRLTLAYQDFDDARRYLSALHDLTELERSATFPAGRFEDHREAVLSSAIIAYGRPFKKSNSAGHAASRLQPENLLTLSCNRQFSDLHEVLISRRDEVVAHSDWKYRNTNIASSLPNVTVRRVSVPDVAYGIDLEIFFDMVSALKAEVISLSYELSRVTQGHQ